MEASTAPAAITSATQARDLTLELGRSYYGDSYNNPDTYGIIANFETNNWKSRAYKGNPEPFDTAIREQLERSQKVIEPYVGQMAVGKTTNVVMRKDDDAWEEWDTPAPFFAEGTIAGIEGHVTDLRHFFDGGGSSYIKELAELTRPSYRIGVVINLTEPLRNNNEHRGIDAPDAEQILVPIRPFPKSMTWFSSLFSDQLTAVPNRHK